MMRISARCKGINFNSASSGGRLRCGDDNDRPDVATSPGPNRSEPCSIPSAGHRNYASSTVSNRDSSSIIYDPESDDDIYDSLERKTVTTVQDSAKNTPSYDHSTVIDHLHNDDPNNNNNKKHHHHPTEQFGFSESAPDPNLFTLTPTSPSEACRNAGVADLSRQIGQSSLLHPADSYALLSDDPPVHMLNASMLAAALHHAASQPLPHPDTVFPWLHGLHQDNYAQLYFLDPARRYKDSIPCGYRGILLIKVGSLLTSKLNGSVAPREVLPGQHTANPRDQEFLNCDPVDGIGLRNFHTQVAKTAIVSDIVLYNKTGTLSDSILNLAHRISAAQINARKKHPDLPIYNTFVVTDPFNSFEQSFPDIVAIDSNGVQAPDACDFLTRERIEMNKMSKATEVLDNLWIGNLADVEAETILNESNGDKVANREHWDIFIECYEGGKLSGDSDLERIDANLRTSMGAGHFTFPSSGTLSVSNMNEYHSRLIVSICSWIHKHIEQGNRILIFCQDGYTESSLLALCLIIYITGVPAHQAYIDLHLKYNRSFFSFPSDVTLLLQLQSALLKNSPAPQAKTLSLPPTIPGWFNGLDGSLPSKILDHMYLGNLLHANNPGLLRRMGITRILSVGEKVDWAIEESEEGYAVSSVLYVDQIQDDGIDSLSKSINVCLDYLDEGYRNGQVTLVHCRVGVSRSATVCIAEVMRRLKMSLAKAYMFVRTRRLNVIIQPNLRFMYELMKWEETELGRGSGQSSERKLNRYSSSSSSPQMDYFDSPERHIVKRDIEWPILCREIANMNSHYIN